MLPDPPKFSSASTLERAFAQVRQIVEDGLRHGFFECEISGEVVNGKKRRLVIKSGKSHHFTIAEEELPRG
jgi:hypothetical protein